MLFPGGVQRRCLCSHIQIDLRSDAARLRPLIAELNSYGTRVSLFVDADCDNVEIAAELGAARIEFADYFGNSLRYNEFQYQLCSVAGSQK